MSDENESTSAEAPPSEEQDAMAAEWEAALAQQSSSPASTDDIFGSASEVTNPAAQGTPAAFANFASASSGNPAGNDINMILDIPVQLTVELGRTRIPIKNILQLAQGSVVELDALAGEPMDVLVNGFLIAQGEVVVVNDKFGIRLTDIVTPSERMRRLSRGG
ncbi:MAG: flagellar motor switch protein FliN [Rubrivivax sp.]|nr:MAG: flagellar motor switch protein FliN [Rubrivivax sp.]